MIQNRKIIIEIILRYCSFLKKINYVPLNSQFLCKNLQNESSVNLLAYLKQIQLVLNSELSIYSENKAFGKLLKEVTSFLKSHILFQEMIMNVDHYLAIIVMEIIQTFTYHKGYISYTEEPIILEKLTYIGRNGTQEQINLCRNLLLLKKNLLREALFNKAFETLPN